MRAFFQQVLTVGTGVVLVAALFNAASDCLLGQDVTAQPAVRAVIERAERLTHDDFSRVRVRQGGRLLQWKPLLGDSVVYGMTPFFGELILLSADIPLDAAHSKLNQVVAHELDHVRQGRQHTPLLATLRCAASGLTSPYREIALEAEAYHFAGTFCLFYGCQLAAP